MTCKDCYNKPICVDNRFMNRRKAEKTCKFFRPKNGVCTACPTICAFSNEDNAETFVNTLNEKERGTYITIKRRE